MKKVLLLLLAAGVAFYACKKDDAGSGNPETGTPVDVSNPNELTGAVKVFYGTNIKGAMPAATGATTPVLDADGSTVLAVNGRYAVITPYVSSGSVEGYYLQITGADSYFTIDYANPRGARKAPAGGKHSLFKETGEDNSDSLIVIKLPENATADTFCITYAAYDANHNVSNTASACIVVIPAGTSQDGQALVGTWAATREKYSNGDWENVITADSGYASFTCDADTLKQCTQGTGCHQMLAGVTEVLKSEITFQANATYNYIEEEKYTNLQRFHNPCANPVYTSSTEAYTETGGWSYNASTKKLVIVFDVDLSDDDYYYDIVNISVTELTADKMVLSNTANQYTAEYQKK
ncbi:MAG TPA: hypothetical protein VFS25_24840 [Chitinophaga sp.]|uniref:hypothetical protein n=1 Tax=Chitinophaga sp. TaxID=1869181 RepID=UPI002DB62A6F|nr:hypothetical protein [Chitinophaga sp.]HEU4556098.1 hypothetical protein [Chitinophaga sp.]